MKILIASTETRSGGAAIATHRLHKALRRTGVDSLMLVSRKENDDDTVIGPTSNLLKAFSHLRISLDHAPLLLCSALPSAPFHLQWVPSQLGRNIRLLDPDIVHLHWICRGFLSIRSIGKIKAPVVWTLHDMWPFTGGCHYTGPCRRYQEACGCCGQLSSHSKYDLSFWTLRSKRKNWKGTRLTLIAPSRWMRDRALESSLFRDVDIHVIPNGVDVQRFRPLHRESLRDLFGIPRETTLVLFAAMNAVKDKRKGFELLCLSLNKLLLSGYEGKIELAVIGSSAALERAHFPFKIHYMGTLMDEISISMIYAAADVFVTPSLQDNLPNTVMEALASGVPCLAFNVGGISDMIEHANNGYLAKAEDADDLARGLVWILEDKDRWLALAREARHKATREFDLPIIANKHRDVYQRIARDRRVQPCAKKIR